MRIDSVYIEAFGGIKKKQIDFGEGLNIIFGENEDGKTTVMNFIKMMFYGSERNVQSLAKSIRKKYTPWDGTPMAGSVDFTHSGRKYRIEREFRSSNATDSVTLYDLALGTRQKAPADIGTLFFGLSAAAFERSAYVGQFGFPAADENASGEFNSKLSNIALTGDESVSFETVNNRLIKAKQKLKSKGGKTGEYDKNAILLSEYKEKLAKSAEELRIISEIKTKVSDIKSEITVLKTRADELKSKIASEQDVRNVGKLKELLTLKEELDALLDRLKLADGSAIDDMYIGKLKFCISKVETANSKLEAKLSEIETLSGSIEAGLNPPEDANEETALALENEIRLLEESIANSRYDDLKDELEQYKLNTASAASGKILLIVGAVLLVAGAAAAAVLKSLLAVAPAALGVILIVAGIIVSANNKKKAELKESRLKELDKMAQSALKQTEAEKQALFDKKLKLETIRTALSTTAAVIENQQKMLEELKAEYSSVSEEYNKEYASLEEIFKLYKAPDGLEAIKDEIPQLTEDAAKIKSAKQKIAYILKDLNGISYDAAAEKLAQMGESTKTDEDFEKIRDEFSRVTDRIAELREQNASLTAEAKGIISKISNPEELKQKIDSLSSKLSDQNEFCNACDIASEVLCESFAEIRQSFGGALEEKATAIFERLTDGRYGKMTISKAFEIGVGKSDAFSNREIGYLSSGAADQAYLSLRLALASFIGENEALPLLLDDSLAQYDDKRTKLALNYLCEYAKSSQILLFTCHKSIADIADELKASIVSL